MASFIAFRNVYWGIGLQRPHSPVLGGILGNVVFCWNMATRSPYTSYGAADGVGDRHDVYERASLPPARRMGAAGGASRLARFGSGVPARWASWSPALHLKAVYPVYLNAREDRCSRLAWRRRSCVAEDNAPLFSPPLRLAETPPSLPATAKSAWLGGADVSIKTSAVSEFGPAGAS